MLEKILNGMSVKCYVIEWYVLYMNDKNCIKLMSYIWDNVWVVVWWH